MFSFFYCERERERVKKKKKKKKKKSFTRRNIALSNLVEHYIILQKNEWGVTCGTFFKDSWLLCSSNWLKNVLKSRLLMCNSYNEIFEEICIKIVHFLCENMIYPLMPIYIFNLPCGIIVKVLPMGKKNLSFWMYATSYLQHVSEICSYKCGMTLICIQNTRYCLFTLYICLHSECY